MNEPRKITNPFPGLRPFETDEYRLFYGREGQSDELITRLGRTRFLAVVGTSGSGKSSLVRAGLMPALRGGMMAGVGSGWRIAVIRPGGDPVGNLALALAEKDVLAEAGGGLSPAETGAVIEATLRAGSLGLVNVMRYARLAAQEKLLIIVDQFEELFRFRAARAASSTGDDALAFVKLLLEAARQRERNIYVVLTMRSDFLGDCAQFQGLPEAINEGQYLIPRMNRDERRLAITGPVGVTRGKISEPLVSRLLNEVGDNPDQLPLLQHALMRTWDEWKSMSEEHRAVHKGNAIDLCCYMKVGGMEKALSKHADEAYDELGVPGQEQSARQRVAELLFKTLTERGADNREIRRPTRLSEACAITGASADEVVAVVEVFRKEGRSFLMPPAGVPLTPDTVLDISHESLIRNWEKLKGWVSDEAESAGIYRRLAEDAVLNLKGKEALLQDPALSLALDWREKSNPNAAWGRRYHPEYDTAIAYLEKSREAHEATLAGDERRKQEELERERREMEQTRAFAEQQARSARRLRWAAVAMALLLVFALGGAVYAFAMKQFAQASYESAVKATDEAVKARALAEDAKLRAEGLAKDLSSKNDELLVAKADALKRATEAEESEKKALAAQDKAEKAEEAARADRDKAKLASADAIAAKNLADENLKKAKAANERGELTIRGFESSVRDLPNEAVVSFDQLASKIDNTLKHAGGSLSEGDVRDLKRTLAWALTHRGAEQLKLGDLSGAQASFEGSRDIYEADLAKLRQSDKWSQSDDLPNPLRSDMYHGLGQTYHNIALKGGDDAKKYFEQAKGVFLSALEEQKAQFERAEQRAKTTGTVQDFSSLVNEGAKQVTASHLALAHLYRDMDERKEAANHLDELIEFQKKRGNADGLVAARKEYAEYYRDQNLFLGAEKAYKELIDEQEARVVAPADYERRGPELAESYNELAEVYRAQGSKEKRDKVEDTFAAANAIQQLAMRLRRISAMRNSPDLDMKDDSADDPADAAADAYLKLRKPARALALYEYALRVREQGAGSIRSDLWMSYDKLTRLYRRDDFKDFPKDYAKAEHYNQLLIQEVTGGDRKNAKFAPVAVALCAELYAKDPNRYSEAASYYERALKLYEAQEKRDWMIENKTIYALFELYKKLKQPAEQKRAALRRLELLTAEMDKVVGLTGTLPKGSITLVSEYANAARDAAYFQRRDNNVEEAAAVYRKAFAAYNFVTKRIYFVPALESYAKLLDDYALLLGKQDKQADAAKVADSAKTVRAKLSETRNVQEQQAQQGALQPPTGQ
jgi:energy-coupling factor transporter ATP-binding protein EcfA2